MIKHKANKFTISYFKEVNRFTKSFYQTDFLINLKVLAKINLIFVSTISKLFNLPTQKASVGCKTTVL
jgi:hypothetical protein